MKEFEHVEAWVFGLLRFQNGVCQLTPEHISDLLKFAHTAGERKGLKLGQEITLAAIERAERAAKKQGKEEVYPEDGRTF